MKRPTPDQVVEIVSELGADSETVSMQCGRYRAETIRARSRQGAGPEMTSDTYCLIIGNSWHPALDWKRANRDKPFVGLRLDRDNGQVWVLCEQTVDGEGLASSALKALERVLGREGVDLGWFDDVAIAQARSIGHGHRLARAIVKALAVPDAGLDVSPTAVRSAGVRRRRGRAGRSPCGRGDTP